MAASINQFSFSSASSYIYSTETGFREFINDVCKYLESDQFGELDIYFQTYSEIYENFLLRTKALERILLGYLKNPEKNEDDCKRAHRLAILMNKAGYGVCFAKIAIVMCCFQLGYHFSGNTLVEEMIISDRTVFPFNYRRSMDQFYKTAESTGDSVMQSRFASVMSAYDSKLVYFPYISPIEILLIDKFV